MIYSWRAIPEDIGRLSMFDKQLAPVLRPNMLYYLRVLALSTVMIWVPMSLFFGAVYRRSTYIHHTHIELIDLDQGPVGRQITQSALLLTSGNMQDMPTWRVRNDLTTLRAASEWVRRRGWAALVINDGASERLANAANGNTVYTPADAMTLLVSTGRHPIVELEYIQPALTNVAISVQREFSVNYVRQLDTASSALNLATLATRPIAFRISDTAPMSFDLAPVVYLFAFLVGQLCVIGMLITWKATSFLFFLKTRHTHLWLGAVALTLTWAIYIGLLSALAILAFRGPDYTSSTALPFTAGRFFSVWFTTAMVLAAGGLWLLSWFTVLTPELLALASLSMVLPNVASVLTPVETAPRFYRWFYALPFYNGAMLYRHVLSGGFPQIGLNVGVVLGELCLWLLLLWAATWIRQYFVVRGSSDVAGWYRKSLFFTGNKEKDDSGSVADSIDSATSFRVGNLGV
ncbi:hypothetical protein GGI20_002566 [Coemansia sp. BCRC 34301]|nr:hypothetical protein GGI20_002566 [Coemansia sp. BCRC 34301]